MLKIKFQSILIIAIFFIFSACKKEEINPTTPTTPTTPTVPVDTTGNGNNTATANAEAIDQTFFKQIKKASDIFDKNEIWKGYDFSKRGKYLVFKDANNKATRAFIINPHKNIDGAKKLATDLASGLNIYRYDALAGKAQTELDKGNGYYTFDFKIDGKDYYTQIYTERDVNDPNNGSLTLATHEVFHMFQFEKWSFNGTQDEDNYPINKELLALQILETKIAEKFPMEQNKAEIKKYLEMFVAIRSKEIELDPSAGKLVKNMANWQETYEGTARYVEFMANRDIFPNYNPQFSTESTDYLQSKRDVKDLFSFGIWYGTGAALAYMVAESSDTIEEDCINNSLYDQAAKIVNLSAAQKESKLEAAKTEFNWSQIQTEAGRLAALK